MSNYCRKEIENRSEIRNTWQTIQVDHRTTQSDLRLGLQLHLEAITIKWTLPVGLIKASTLGNRPNNKKEISVY